MTNKPKMLFATVATADYLPQAKQLFASAHEAGYWQGQYMVLAYGITAADHQWFESRGILVREYNYIISDEEWKTLDCSKAFHRIVMEKFHLFREDFKQWDIVVYMDCDIIVTAPLIRLAQIQGFGATLDCQVFLKSQIYESGYELLTQNNYDLNNNSFCAGMFAFRSKILTKDTYNKLLRISEQFIPFTLWSDQLFLNLFFYKKWQKLSMAYAFMLTHFLSMPLARATKAIALHFASHNRPWELESPYNSLWKQNLEKAAIIDFRTPRIVDWRVRIEAYIKETFFVPWWLYIRKGFTRRYEMKIWYPYMKKVYKFCKSRIRTTLITTKP